MKELILGKSTISLWMQCLKSPTKLPLNLYLNKNSKKSTPLHFRCYVFPGSQAILLDVALLTNVVLIHLFFGDNASKQSTVMDLHLINESCLCGGMYSLRITDSSGM